MAKLETKTAEKAHEKIADLERRMSELESLVAAIMDGRRPLR